MNYLAHAVTVLDRPWSVAGTSLPDWLRAVDKRARLKPDALRLLGALGPFERELRDGVLKHHDDDLRFHTHAAFEELTHEAVHEIRALSPDPRLRASALGHIAVEMLLDGCIEEARPGSIDAYYEAVAAVDDVVLARCARAWTGHDLAGFESLALRFRRARFLFSYVTDAGVVEALGGVAWRTGIPPPPPGSVDVIRALRPKVRAAAGSLGFR